MTRKGRLRTPVGEDFRIAVLLAIKKFCGEEDKKECEFPSSFTSVERAYLHRYCLSLGLKSKSRGQGANRFLTVYKKEGSTIVQADATFELGALSCSHISNLLQKYSLTARERQDLLPPIERDHILGQDGGFRELNRSLGRLCNGIPSVPPHRCDGEFLQFRQSLPIWKTQDDLIQMISCHHVLLICGETGSGKTTQVPQFILDHCAMTGQLCRIICTQPRRIAAISIAERVAFERDEKVGQTVGYQVRLESRTCSKTLLTFCTHGVLLRTLMGGDASLATVSHIIVDELHERDRFSDFLLIVLRDLLLKFRNLRLVLMSASLDVQLFCKYFSSCPIIEVPGRLFDVKTFFLEDILKGTGYTNKAMIKYKKENEKKKSRKKVDFWCAVQKGETSRGASGGSDADNYIDAIGIEDLSLNPQRMSLENDFKSRLSATMDKVIEDGWLGPGSDLSYMMQLIISDNVSVDYQHTETYVSPLMLAAGKGNIDVVEQLLMLGASIHLESTNGWTAIDWAHQFGHQEIGEVISSQWNFDDAHQYAASSVEEQLETAEEDKLLLDAYNHSIDEEKIDYDLIICLLSRICATQEEGSILIFLPGYDDIVSLRERIHNETHNIPENRTMIFTLHSQMQTNDQKRVFRTAPPGVRKIILSTNIAETSITINDVVFVVDAGKVKEKTYDAMSGVTQLKANWISKANATQRRGRAGRCRPGFCYHLFSRARFASLRKFQVPEILRVPIHELCLQAKLLAPPNAPIADFLAKAPNPPPFMVTRNAVMLLKTIDALDPWEELTELGLHLLDLSIEPHLGKMILCSVALKCLDPILTIVCCLSYRYPFLIPPLPNQKRLVSLSRRKFACETFSDHMVLLRAFQGWQKAKIEGHERHYCAQHCLSHASMQMVAAMRSQLLEQLKASGFVKALGVGDIRDLNTNSEVWPVVKAALCAGNYPNLIRVDRERQQLITQKESKVRFRHSSVLNKMSVAGGSANSLHRQLIAELPSDWLLYEEMMRTGTIALAQTCSLVSPITVAIFAGPARLSPDALHEPYQARLEGYMEEDDSEDDSKCDNQKAVFKIDDWISFRIEPEIARLAVQLRQKWHALFLKRMHAPTKLSTQADEQVIRTITNVLVAEDQALNLLQPSALGQRPRPILSGDFKPQANFKKPVIPSQRNATYYNSSPFSTSGLQCYPNDQSMMSKMAMASSSGYRGYSSQHSQPQPSFSSQPCNMSYSHTNSRVRYFIIKANTSRVVEVSMVKNVWAFTPATERKLVMAVKEGKEVILIFSIQGSGHFQGFARLTLCRADHCPPEFSLANFGPCYQIEWIKKASIPFQSTRHLQNALNENRKVQIARDGQELEPIVGDALCKLIAKGQPVLTPDMNKAVQSGDVAKKKLKRGGEKKGPRFRALQALVANNEVEMPETPPVEDGGQKKKKKQKAKKDNLKSKAATSKVSDSDKNVKEKLITENTSKCTPVNAGLNRSLDCPNTNSLPASTISSNENNVTLEKNTTNTDRDK